MTLTEAVKAMQAGDESAFPVIYKETSGQAMAVIRRYCSTGADCEDLLQDTYVQVYKYIYQLQDPKGVQGWVNTIAQRIAIAHLKKQKAHPQQIFSEMENEDGQIQDFEDEREDIRPELVADRKAVTEIVNQILALLTPEQRDALMMVYGQKMTIKEMAGNLGISENTIKSRLHQGKKKLMSYKADFRRLGVELPVVGIGTVLAVAFEENMAAEAAGLAVSGAIFVGSEAAKETAAGAAVGSHAGTASAVGTAQASAASGSATAAGAANTGTAASAGAGLSTAAGAGAASATGTVGVGAAAGMAVCTKALIGVAAAAIIAGGGVAVKTMVLDQRTETEAEAETEAAITESSAAETEAAFNAISEPTELFECFGLSKDEIIAKYGEPADIYGGTGSVLDVLEYPDTGMNFVLEADMDHWDDENVEKYCKTVYCENLNAFIDETTDIFDFVTAVHGQVRGYHRWTKKEEEEPGEDMWRGSAGQTEVDIASELGISYRFFLNDPKVITVEDHVVFQSADITIEDGYAGYNAIGTEDKTEEFRDYLGTVETLERQEQKEAELAAAYYEMLQSGDAGYSCIMSGLDALEWQYADLDGDGTDEILFSSNSTNASGVGIGKMVNGKAVYCGETGGTGCVTYYPGTGKLIYEQWGAGGHTEGICSLTNNQLQIEAEASYSIEYNDTTEDYDTIGSGGVLNGREVSAEEAQAYIDAFTEKNGVGESFGYGEAGNRRYEELADLADLAWSSSAGQSGGTSTDASAGTTSVETTAETAAAAVSGTDYIFPDSSNRALTTAEVAGLSKDQLKIARNEIFARHGYIFTTPEMKSYFESKSWYHGSIPNESFDTEAMLSQVEKDNIKLIKGYE